MGKTYRGWATVLAAMLGSGAGAGVIATYAFGIFIKGIAAEYQWTRSETTLGITIFFLCSGVGSVCLGSILARWSIKNVTMTFVALFAIALGSVALLPNSVLLFAITFAIIGFFASAATPMPYAIAIAGWFDRRRGMALAIAATGAAFGGVFVAGYANWLLANYGWRGGYVGLGLFGGLIPLAGLLLLFHTPPRPAVALSEAQVPEERVLTFSDLVFRDRTFWVFGLPIFFISIAGGGVVTNLAPILTDRGMSMADASMLIGVVGGSTIISRIVVGVLLDYVHVRYVGCGIFLLLVVGLILIAGNVGMPLTLIAGMTIGLAMGAESDLVTFGVSRYYSSDALSRALGGIWICWAWGGGAGVALASACYDLSGSYDIAMILFAVMTLAGALIILRLGAYRYGARH